MDGGEFNHHMDHPSAQFKVNLTDFIPYLDGYAVNRHDPWRISCGPWMTTGILSIPTSKELTETDIARFTRYATTLNPKAGLGLQR